VCWLRGFTETGERNGQLFVTDLIDGRQWPSNPLRSGAQRNYNRIAGENPLVAENAYAEAENVAAPILRRIYVERNNVLDEERSDLLFFMALQWTRVPTFREAGVRITLAAMKRWCTQALESPDSLAAAARSIGVGGDEDRAAEVIRQVAQANDASAPNEWHLSKSFRTAQRMLPSLAKRFWTVRTTRHGNYIGSDNPVVLDGPKGKSLGYKNADLLVYPLTRFSVLAGTLYEEQVVPPITQRQVAETNSLMMLDARRYVFSHEPDFLWIDGNNRYSTDWSMFMTDEKMQALRALRPPT
jgi:hypothetical protein